MGSVEIVEDSSPGPFEGPEKLLELWFQPSAEHVKRLNLPLKGGRRGKSEWYGLRQVDRSVWDGMLGEVECKVLSVIEGEQVDAYLLSLNSESSMFVWPHKLILKTCGTTTLLLGLPTLLRIASEICGLRGVWRCFYSRKAFMFPDRQRGPHKDWTHEMKFLDKLFENSSAYTVGRMNGDHWLLYLTPPQDDVLQPYALASSAAIAPPAPTTPLEELSEALSFNLARHDTPLPSPGIPHKRFYQPDQTLEILMTRLDPGVCKSFYHPGAGTYTSSYDANTSSDAHSLGAELSDKLGLSALLPEAAIDSFLFSPCGYSSNAVQDDRYATIHVTPEQGYSYASFETNVDFPTSKRGPKKLQELVNKVLDIFRPASMSITLFVSDDDDQLLTETDSVKQKQGQQQADHAFQELLNPRLLAQYERLDKIIYSFEGYRLLYCVFSLRDAPASS